MTHAAIARFHARRKLLSKWDQPTHLALVQTPTRLAVLSTCAPDLQVVSELCETNNLRWDMHVTSETIDTHLDEFTRLYDQKRVDSMWDNCRTEVIYSIINTFGVGKLASAFDKKGGNVATIHNVRQGIYATEEEHQKFDARGEYDSNAYHSHDAYKAANARNSEMLKNGSLIDAYTGELFHLCVKNDAQRTPNLDHIVAAKNIHDDAGRVLADINGLDLANIEVNLTPTSGSINKAKGTKTAAELTRHLNTQAPERKARIQELLAKGDTPTDQERKQLAKLQQLDKVDHQRLAQKEAAAQTEIDRQINTSYYTSSKFARKLAATSATESVKAGMQSALGEILVEFFESMFDEITDWAKHGRNQDSLLGEIKARLHTVARRCEGKLQAAMTAFKQGSISGFFSNLVNTLINSFFTTTKRMARMMREGFSSLLRGIQTLLFPPEGMTYREAAHEASKILLAGGIVIGAIAVEEWLEKQLAMIPILASIARVVVPALVGALTALVTTLGVYLIDQADMLGVMRAKRLAGTTALIDESIGSLEARVEALCTSCQ